VEAGARSGANSTVQHALELGREVFAVPGPIGRDTSVGSNALLKDGATLVTGVGDVLAGLPASVVREAERRARSQAVSGSAPKHAGRSNGAALPAGHAPDAAPHFAMATASRSGLPIPPDGTPPGDLWRVLDTEPRHVDDLAA